ncbi:MAG TPA: GNAT family N-acetyltransferase [Candidatus Saccharimonadales bacterium]|nr:GNAT family N-acetyltransferase [Candidatus Saccharimonadales bacterium]
MDLPRRLAEHATPLPIEQLRAELPAAASALARLQERGFMVCNGLTPELLGEAALIASEPHIGVPYPEDKRTFGHDTQLDTALQKGMAGFALLGPQSRRHTRPLVGYGWLQDKDSENFESNGVQHAVRIREKWQGQGLAADFSRAVLGTGKVLYGANQVRADFWMDDRRAAHVAQQLGFSLQACVEQERVTQKGRVMGEKLQVALDVQGPLQGANYY